MKKIIVYILIASLLLSTIPVANAVEDRAMGNAGREDEFNLTGIVPMDRTDAPTAFGIDVSHHQGTIDWDIVAPQIDFAIIRCGYGDDLTSQDDRQWTNNVEACTRLGIPFGVYIYSYALSEAEALSEANHVLRLIEGYTPTLPIYFDLEDPSILNNCSTTQILNITRTFCEAIEAEGYKAGVYANRNWWTNYLTSSEYDQWDRWYARYASAPGYSKDYTMWQYSETGSIDGISGNVDLNHWYGAFPPQETSTNTTAGDGTYIWPADTGYPITQSYTKAHGGFDLGTPIGSDVYAIASGTVIKAQDYGCQGSHGANNNRCSLGTNCPAYKAYPDSNGSYANWIIIDHGNNVYSLYAHLKTDSFKVAAGQTVKQGQLIASSGNAGNTRGNTGAHLHFELRIGGNAQKHSVDPEDYLTKINIPFTPTPPAPPRITLSESTMNMHTGNYYLGENVTISWYAENSDTYWLQIRNNENGSYVINESVTGTSYTFNPSAMGSYTVSVRAYNAAGESEKSTHTFRVRGIVCDTWVSNKMLGEEGISFPAGVPLYYNYKLFDPQTGDLLYTFGSKEYAIALTIKDDAGNIVATKSYSNIDQAAMEFHCEKPGNYRAEVSVNGTVYYSAFAVFGSPDLPTIQLSQSAHDMHTGNYYLGESVTITWDSKQADSYWLQIRNDENGSYVVNEPMTDASYTFTPDDMGAYTVSMHAYNEAGDSGVTSKSFRVRGVFADSWVSETALGEEITYVPAGVQLYYNYKLFDPLTGDLLYTYSDKDYTTTLSVFNANGVQIAHKEFTNLDQESLVFQCDKPGAYTAEISLPSGTYHTDFVVYGPPKAPVINLSKSAHQMNTGNYYLSEKITISWEATNATSYWLQIRDSDTEAILVNEPRTDANYTFIPEEMGSYTVAVRAYNAAGESDKAVYTFRVRGIMCDTWVSEKMFGSEGTLFSVGIPLYYNYKLFDPGTGDLLYTYGSKEYVIGLSIKDSNGNVVANKNFSNTDQSAIAFQCEEPGNYRAEVSVNGTVYYSTFTITNHSFTNYASDGNATCTQDGTKTAKCNHCDATDTIPDLGSALGHAFGAWSVIKEPTTTEEGMEEHTCARCNHTEQRSIAKLENPFTDVAPGNFFYEPVLWAIENGITNGTSATTFGPNDQCMRAHVVTFLWRAVGSPEPTRTDNPFVDVKPADFYYKPVLWAVENGITSGMDATHFGPTAYCNRAQVVTFLYRTMGNPDVGAATNPFTDVAAGSFYERAVFWAVENGVTAGLSATSFGPNSICNRAQIVTFLYRAFVNE